MIGYAARLRLLRHLLREGHGPARVGAAGQGAAAALLDEGTRVTITPAAVVIMPPEGTAAGEAAMDFAARLSALADVPLAGADPDAGMPGQTDGPG